MKKILVLLLALVMSLGCFVGCNEAEQPSAEKTEEEIIQQIIAENEELEKYYLQQQDAQKGTKITHYIDPEIDQAPLNNGETTYLGHGINLFKGPTYSHAVMPQWFKSTVYRDNDKPENIVFTNDKDSNKTSVAYVGSSVSDAYSNFGIDAGISTGKSVPFFSGSVESQYSKSTSYQSTAKFYNAIVSIRTNKQELLAKYTGNPDLIAGELIDEEVLEIINDSSKTPSKLFNAIGTHLITGAMMGGTVNVCAAYNSAENVSNETVKASLDFATNWVSGKVSTSMEEKHKNVQDNTTITVQVSGGVAQNFSTASFDALGESIDNWSKTVVPKNAVLCEITQVVPIWEFATTEARKNELQQAFESKADDTVIKLKGYTDPKTVYNVEDKGVYMLKPYAAPNKTMDGIAKDGNVYLWKAYDDYAVQQWRAEAVNGEAGYYFFKHISNEQYLTQTLRGSGNSSNINAGFNTIQQRFIGTYSQMFRIQKNDDGTVHIISKLSDDTDMGYKIALGCKGRYGDGENVYGLKYRDDRSQKWLLTKVN